jgi:regulator of protease activity HflC (stomatin/prohibitin superfamily)
MELISIFLVLLIAIFFAFGLQRVTQSEQRVVERLGRYKKTLGPGLHVIIPFIEQVRAKKFVTENQLPTDEISTITLDNVKIEMYLEILWRIVEAEKTVYRIGGARSEDADNTRVERAINTTVVGVVRSVIGRTEFDAVQSNRSQIVEAVEKELKLVAEEWGVVISRVEITEIKVDEDTRKAMQLQINAERERRALVRQAEGRKEAAQLAADAELYTAQKQAEAKKTLAEAEAYAVSVVAKSIADGGAPAVEFEVKKIQAQAVESIGTNKSSKIVLLPSDVLDSFGKLASKFLNKN